MVRTAFAVACAFAAFASVALAEGAGQKEAGAGVKTAAGQVNDFARDMYLDPAARQGNLFFSPYSVHSALAMTLAGARGETARQMQDVLHAAGAQAAADSYAQLSTHLKDVQKRGGFDLNIASSIWGEQSVKFLQRLTSTLERDYRAQIMRANFRSNAEGARQKINAWVKDQTREKIPELLAGGVLTRDTSLVLVNAIYFKARWASVFEKDATRDGDFFADGTDATKTRMMHQKLSAQYAENARVQLLELPYRGPATSMLVLLPKEKTGIRAAEQTFTSGELDQLLRGMRREEVQLTLPAFKMKYQADLAKGLSEMGMPLAFTDRADFRGVTDCLKLHEGYASGLEDSERRIEDVSEEVVGFVGHRCRSRKRQLVSGVGQGAAGGRDSVV